MAGFLPLRQAARSDLERPTWRKNTLKDDWVFVDSMNAFMVFVYQLTYIYIYICMFYIYAHLHTAARVQVKDTSLKCIYCFKYFFLIYTDILFTFH